MNQDPTSEDELRAKIKAYADQLAGGTDRDRYPEVAAGRQRAAVAATLRLILTGVFDPREPEVDAAMRMVSE